jgi:hypothetical protein
MCGIYVCTYVHTYLQANVPPLRVFTDPPVSALEVINDATAAAIYIKSMLYRE